jgi:hypothetical protein
MKRFISLMVLFAFASFSWAQDVEEEEEEEEVVEVVKAKPAAKKAAGQSRMGLQIGYNGSLDDIRVVYDMGTGLKAKVGLDFYQYQAPAPTATDLAATEAKNEISIALGFDYQLGNKLLPYGLSCDLGYNLETKRTELFPAFYTEVELVKNLTLGLQSGAQYYKEDKDTDAVIRLTTKGLITFYFM